MAAQSRRLSVRISDRLYDGISRAAARTGKGEADLVREALERYLGAQDLELTCFTLAQRSRLIGCVRTAPSDLSTNREHMDGFGRE
jgi:predicted DNA-binding protein